MKRSLSWVRCFIKEFSLRNEVGKRCGTSSLRGEMQAMNCGLRTQNISHYFHFLSWAQIWLACAVSSSRPAPPWLTLNESWERGSQRLQPAGERLRLLLPPPGCITWLVLSWLSVVLTAWPPGGSPAKCHVTSGSASPGPGPQSFSHPHSPLTPPSFLSTCTWHYLKKRTICLFLSIFSSLCFCSVRWEGYLGAVVSSNGNANIKQCSSIVLLLPPLGDHPYLLSALKQAEYKHSYRTG